jgi:transposase
MLEICGIGTAGAARALADVGDIAWLRRLQPFRSWTGTARLDASSGEQIRHRLSRIGNRQMNHVIHIAAIVQLRRDTEGRAYCRGYKMPSWLARERASTRLRAPSFSSVR